MSCRKYRQYRVYDIKWETDGQNVILPSETTISVPACEDEIEYITDQLSDIHGFLHNGYQLELVNG